MKILSISSTDVLRATPLNDLNKVVYEVKKTLVRRVKEASLDDKLVISPSRERMFTAYQADDALRTKYEQLDLDQKISSLISVGINNAGVKLVGANSLNRERGLLRSESIIILYANDTLKPTCIMSGTDISSLRTGAYSSIVGEYLMPKERGNIVACIGSGVIAEACLLSLGATLTERISQIFVYSPSSKSRDDLVERVKGKIDIDIISVPTVDDAVNNADFIITATTSLNPVIDDPVIKEKATVLLLGGDEVGTGFLYRCYHHGLIVCDDWDLVKHRNDQSLPYLFNKDNELDEEKIIDLWQLITGDIDPRNHECVFVNCVGVPTLDIQIASEVYRHAIQNGVGQFIEL